MELLQLFWSASVVLLLLCLNTCNGLDCQSSNLASTIIVDKSAGKGQFTTVQQAINFMPPGNDRWIRILISPGIYNEKVTIPMEKPCIFLQGAGRNATIIAWNDHQEIDTSATFTSYPHSIVAKGITFQNTYSVRIGHDKTDVAKAVAARIYGDKSAFYGCGFIGLQDTLWDATGRHYFRGCRIEGAIDFIFGEARSIFEGCAIVVNLGIYYPENNCGSITAHRRMSANEQMGFVFKACQIKGNGKALLGRAWGPYSTVIIANSTISDVVVPEGWDAWLYPNNTGYFTYVESGNNGPGSDTSKRVPWVKKLIGAELNRFLSISYINEDGWLQKLPRIS